MILLIYVDFGGNQLLKKCPKQFGLVPPHQLGRCLKERVFFGEDFPYGNTDIMISFHFPFPPLLCEPTTNKIQVQNSTNLIFVIWHYWITQFDLDSLEFDDSLEP